MSKGLYHCSRCKQHFYDHEATAMHIKDKHQGKGEVLRHPTKKELLIREEQHLDRIEELQAEVNGAHEIILSERAEVLRLRERVKELEGQLKKTMASLDRRLRAMMEDDDAT